MPNNELREKSKARIIELLKQDRQKLLDDLRQIQTEIDKLDDIINSVSGNHDYA